MKAQMLLSKMLKFLKTTFLVSIGGIIIVVATIWGVDALVEKLTSDKLYSEVSQVPERKVGVLLGTSKSLANGRTNLYYKYRIEAAVALYKQGKIDFILVSGDNSTKYYDEPTTIKADLEAAGIPSEKIVLDYAGFRTLDSIVRAKEVFGQQSFTVISQPFHNERAVFIADWKGIDAIGFNARAVSARYGIKVQVRERFARVKMMLDLLFGIKPKFLGPEIEIS